MHKVRKFETVAERWHRLAKLAEDQGLHLLTEAHTGARFVTSATIDGEIHRVTLDGCDCEGHRRWGRCKHRALLLSCVGKLPSLTPVDGRIPGLSAEETNRLKAEAMRHHWNGGPLVSVYTGEIIAEAP